MTVPARQLDAQNGNNVRNKLALLGMSVIALLVLSKPVQAIAQAGGLFPDSFNVTCGTAPTIIRSDKGQQSYECRIPAGGADVFVGYSAETTTEGTLFSVGTPFGGPFAYEYCMVASGTQVITCRAQVLSP